MTEIVITAEVDLNIVIHGKLRTGFRVEGHTSSDSRGIYLCRLEYWRESTEDWLTLGDGEEPYIEAHRDALLAAVRAQWALDLVEITAAVAG